MAKSKKDKTKRVHLASGGRLKGTRNSTFQFESSQTETRPLDDGYTGLEPDNTSTIPNDPSQAITRANDSVKKVAPSVTTSGPQAAKLGRTQTVTDGSTKVTSTVGAPGKYEPNDVSAGARQAYFGQHGSYPPCINPDCKSYGKPHPNCLCYGPTSSQAGWATLAHGGTVGMDGFCSSKRMHRKGCEYFLDGGAVGDGQPMPEAVPQFQDDPETTLDHAGVEEGLLGLIKHTGKTYPSFDSDKHGQVIQDAKDQHGLRSSPLEGFEPLKKTPGNKLGDLIADGNYDKAADSMAGHSLTGSISPTKLKPILQRMAGPLLSEDVNPAAMRGSVDYLSTAMRGKSTFDKHMDSFFGPGEMDTEHHDENDDELKSHLDDLRDHPEKALDIGGSLGHYLPDHGSALGAKAAVAMNYFKSLKPTQSQNSPLDEVSPYDQAAENSYNRQISIANNPMLLLKHAKEGTLVPQDLATVHTLYPKMAEGIKKKMSEKLIDHKSTGAHIPYHLRQAMSQILGQPMDSTMTPMAMQAIIHSAGPQQANQQAGKTTKATGVQLKQMNKVNDMFKTSLQKLQTSDK